ncbi:hypothetical protein BU16DRAFT_111262 [Lophium mytilinum]|uniref:Uncharacterized protein n=1 Tax=Lophium mytilinum TaxID=390894 RepID=A0A6A6QJW6_9PEZI|nr:hypothetical protein BU16DRAFT_111262 [Lophium mytilinum]
MHPILHPPTQPRLTPHPSAAVPPSTPPLRLSTHHSQRNSQSCHPTSLFASCPPKPSAHPSPPHLNSPTSRPFALFALFAHRTRPVRSGLSLPRLRLPYPCLASRATAPMSHRVSVESETRRCGQPLYRY